MTALFELCKTSTKNSNLDEIDKLLKGGHDSNIKDEHGKLPIAYCATDNDLIKCLLLDDMTKNINLYNNSELDGFYIPRADEMTMTTDIAGKVSNYMILLNISRWRLNERVLALEKQVTDLQNFDAIFRHAQQTSHHLISQLPSDMFSEIGNKL